MTSQCNFIVEVRLIYCLVKSRAMQIVYREKDRALYVIRQTQVLFPEVPDGCYAIWVFTIYVHKKTGDNRQKLPNILT